MKSRSVPSTGVSAPVGSPRSSRSRVWRAGTLQDGAVDRLGPGRQVGVETEAEGDRRPRRATARRASCTVRPSRPTWYSISSSERERVARRGVELQAQGELVLVPGLERPRHPAHQAVDGVVALGLVEGGLGPHPVELVAAVGQPVRPRGQDLAPTRVGPLVGPKPSMTWWSPDRVGPQGGAHLADHDLLARRARCATAAPSARRRRSWASRAVMATELKQTRTAAGEG